MEKKKFKVIYEPKAEQSIFRISVYISEKGYKETAVKFTDRLYNFGDSLALFPEKYPVCKKPLLAKRKLRCAVFKKNYIFIYSQQFNQS
jgi:plasmid stabilization system protein ParE